MKRNLFAALFLLPGIALFAQKTAPTISAAELKQIESVLAADDMKGRKLYSPELDRAAEFIADGFKKAGLQPFSDAGEKTFLQRFSMVNAKQLNASATVDGQAFDAKNFVVITTQPTFSINERSGYQVASIGAGKNLFREAQKYISGKANYVVFVNPEYEKNFARLSSFKRGLFQSAYSVVFLLTAADPKSFTIEATHELTAKELMNVVGIIPGKKKKGEYVIFSGHYDHIGTGKAVNGDSIYNGANDDASGIAAVMTLAKYYKALGNNERTLVFAAFTAEESGGFGAQYFSRQFDPAKVIAMFNIEMIGTESKWGKNSAYITGYDKTDMGKILEKNLANTGFTFYPDPYPDQNLFYRSDNATLARLGVPAHTISTSKMDSEPNYHKVTDHVETLDMENMAMIVRSIALSARSIVAGVDAPSRVTGE